MLTVRRDHTSVHPSTAAQPWHRTREPDTMTLVLRDPHAPHRNRSSTTGTSPRPAAISAGWSASMAC
jgi:hypothetical protein